MLFHTVMQSWMLLAALWVAHKFLPLHIISFLARCVGVSRRRPFHKYHIVANKVEIIVLW